jgi:CRISPR/Cas system-associated protein Cas10 (large subunit of type III CRISPR-Cas system)
MTWKYLVSLDIGAIHEYIFGTNKLREIRGASILLDSVNRTMPLGMEGIDWECVVAGGGNIKVPFAEENKATLYRDTLKKLFTGEVPVSDVTVIVSEKKNGWTDEDWIKNAAEELNKEKRFKRKCRQILTSSYFKTCQACGLNPAEHVEPHIDKRFICKNCNQKIINAQNYTSMKIYEEIFNRLNFVNAENLPDDFNDIGTVSKPEGYIGFIYTDGNKMGEHLKQITDFKNLKGFSSNVDEATIDATVCAVGNNFGIDNHKFQVILAGGDDMIIAVPADKAMQIAIDFCKEFNQRVAKYDLSTSASVVICRDSLPIKTILEVAEAVLKNAKIKSRLSNKTYIDFIAMTGSVMDDIIAKRNKEFEYSDSAGGNSLTMRPYSINEIDKLIKTIQAFKEEDFPRNKIKGLYSNLFKGHNIAYLEGAMMNKRLSDRHRRVIDVMKTCFSMDRFPWTTTGDRRYATPWCDMTELYDFIHGDSND